MVEVILKASRAAITILPKRQMFNVDRKPAATPPKNRPADIFYRWLFP
jgi:hypothetical protein